MPRPSVYMGRPHHLSVFAALSRGASRYPLWRTVSCILQVLQVQTPVLLPHNVYPTPQGRLTHLGPVGFIHLFTDIYWASALPRPSCVCGGYSSVENTPSPCPQGVYSLTENTVITVLMVVLAAGEMHRTLGTQDGEALWNLEALEGPLRNWYQSMTSSEGCVDGQVRKKTVSGERNIFS